MSNQDPIAEQFKRIQVLLMELSTASGQLAELFEERAHQNLPEMLTETQMAAHLGITKRAIQGRRSRGQIPPEVCQKVGSTWFYSLRRYEDWLESLWPPIPAIPPVRRAPRKRPPHVWIR